MTIPRRKGSQTPLGTWSDFSGKHIPDQSFQGSGNLVRFFPGSIFPIKVSKGLGSKFPGVWEAYSRSKFPRVWEVEFYACFYTILGGIVPPWEVALQTQVPDPWDLASQTPGSLLPRPLGTCSPDPWEVASQTRMSSSSSSSSALSSSSSSPSSCVLHARQLSHSYDNNN